MRKKVLSILLAATMSLAMISGCGSAAENSVPSATTEAKTEAVTEDKAVEEKAADTAATNPVTVKFWNSFTGSDGDKLVELVNQFNEENTDGITVEMDISSNLDEQLSSAFAAGEGPTLLLFSSASRFTYGDHMQSMNDIFDKTSLDKNDFIESYIDYCSEDGQTYLIPFQIVSFSNVLIMV